jgi:hypothetical protein
VKVKVVEDKWKKISEVLVRFGGRGGRGEEYREATWNEGGTETNNCTCHHGKRNENQQLGAEFNCAHKNNYGTLVAIECTVQC